MNPILIAIIQLASGILKVQLGDTSAAGQDVAIAADLISIVTKAISAVEQHTGQPIDLSLILPEARLDPPAPLPPPPDPQA